MTKEVLEQIAEAAQAFLAAKKEQRTKKAHELRKAANRLYAVEQRAASK